MQISTALREIVLPSFETFVSFPFAKASENGP
jgi:hypothetical protein